MEIKSDVSLKGGNWRKALDVFAPFFPRPLLTLKEHILEMNYDNEIKNDLRC